MTKRITLPNKENDIDHYVPFVKDMTTNQLEVMICRLFMNFQELASTIEENSPNVSTVIDKILSGITWNKKDLLHITNAQRAIVLKGIAVTYNKENDTFKLYDAVHNDIIGPVKATDIPLK